MKTTIDLPERLVREMKILAARDGRKLKEVAAELLEVGFQNQKNRAKAISLRENLLEAPRSAPEMTAETVKLLLEDSI